VEDELIFSIDSHPEYKEVKECEDEEENSQHLEIIEFTVS
jgi:hypothetical protein